MRVKNIDEDTSVGYIYEEQKFFVTNKGTTTKRLTAPETMQVLDIVAPDQEVVSLQDLIDLSVNYETITDLYFTYSDTGAYISSIQLNDYFKYPLTLNAEKSKLYIMNTEIIFDLKLNEGMKNRLLRIQSFYKDILGLDIPLNTLRLLYRTLTNYYNPTCFNIINSTQNEDGSYTYRYNNIISLSNYRGNSPAVYTLVCNPTNQYDTDNTIGYIIQIQENAILLTDNIEDQVHSGDTLYVYNTNYNMGAFDYSADGKVTVSEVSNNLITTTENMPSTYIYQPPVLNIVAYKTPVLDVDRDARTITLTNIAEASQFLVGDTIQIQGTIIQTEYETLTVDGQYTIIGIKDNQLYIEDSPITNYTAPIGATPPAYVYKPIKVGYIGEIKDVIGGSTSVITMYNTVPTILEVGTAIAVALPNADSLLPPTLSYATVTGIDQEQNLVTVDAKLDEYTANYGLLRKPLPYPYVSINILQSNNEDKFPTGEFIVDNSTQAIDYIDLGYEVFKNRLVKPTQSNFDLVGTEVSKQIHITEIGGNPVIEQVPTTTSATAENPSSQTPTTTGSSDTLSLTATLLGLFSQVYGKQDSTN